MRKGKQKTEDELVDEAFADLERVMNSDDFRDEMRSKGIEIDKILAPKITIRRAGAK